MRLPNRLDAAPVYLPGDGAQGQTAFPELHDQGLPGLTVRGELRGDRLSTARQGIGGAGIAHDHAPALGNGHRLADAATELRPPDLSTLNPQARSNRAGPLT